jgi:hypothetical protein
MACLTFLALCGVRPRVSWKKARRQSLTLTRGIMAFAETEYKKSYAPNTRETFRRQVLHQFIQASVALYNPDDPNLPTNSPKVHYAISDAALSVAKVYPNPRWKSAAKQFVAKQGSLLAAYQKHRKKYMVPVVLPDGRILSLSPGKHNRVQAAVVQEFMPQFVPGAQILYLGDTETKQLYKNEPQLRTLRIPITQHDKLPDVILFDAARNWLILVEAVTSHGPMTPKRVKELRKVMIRSKADLVLVSAFPTAAMFRKHAKEIAWETEVWIADTPDHMIHFNGERFLGPYE